MHPLLLLRQKPKVYEALLRPFGGRIPKRVKTQVAAAAELGDVKAGASCYGNLTLLTLSCFCLER